LTNLQLGHRAVELGAPKLTALILETTRQAQKKMAAQVVEAFRPLGEGTQSMKMITDIIAAEADEEPEEELHAVERIEEDDPVPDPVAAPVAGSRPTAPAAVGPRGPRPADDQDDDDENQPW
jgi:hypothetical protein